MKKPALRIIILFVLLTPLWSYLVWWIWPSEKIDILIIDKSSTTETRDEHRSFNWILTHEKKYKPHGGAYDYSKDYMGFFPEGSDNYKLYDLEGYNSHVLDSLVENLDLVYLTDAKGVGDFNWNNVADTLEDNGLIYGGVGIEDYELIRKMLQSSKLVMTEYSALGYPTAPEIRVGLEEIFQLKYSGWSGKYFESLSKSKNLVPEWLIDKYEEFSGEEYDFDNKKGIILLHETAKVLVLEDGLSINPGAPSVLTSISNQRKYNLPNFINYGAWFEINEAVNEEDVISSFKIHTTNEGDSILAANGLSNKFPAVIGDSEKGLRYYFCGDFADHNINESLARFSGIDLFYRIWYSGKVASNTYGFFWNYYSPLIKSVLNNYDQNKVNSVEEDLSESGESATDGNYDGKDSFEEGEEETILESNVVDNESNDDQIQPEATINYVRDNISRFKVGGRRPYNHEETRNQTDYTIADNIEYDNGGANFYENSPFPVVDESNPKWRIVIVSLRSEEGTRRYLKQLNNPEIEVVRVEYLNTHRVAFGPYDDLGEAQRKFQQVLGTYPEAWMIKF